MLHLGKGKGKSKGKSKVSGLVFISLLLLTVIVSACGDKQASTTSAVVESQAPSPSTSPVASEPVNVAKVVKDGMGHEVTIPANPEKIIGSYLEDHLVALNIKPIAQWSIGTGTVQDYLQTALQGVPLISYDLPLEAVTSFGPDLILVGSESSVQKGIYEQLAKIAPTYVLGDAITKDWRQALLKVGELLGKTTEAEKALEDYDKKAGEAKEKLHNVIADQSAAVLWLVQKQFYLVDETQSSGAVLYGDLGIKRPNLVTDIPDASKATWNPISLEKLAELNADHIFLVNSDKAEGADTLNDPIWQGLPAVKAGHVYEMASTKSWLYTGYIAGGQIIDDVLSTLAK
ncbi:MAG: iron-hydroxamate ABC transporter substrate-binding protein [Gorillibacterium sp.]|nr:iron-hydroxamate ABC transporter substrate-binding protein [Gorillibacterium sp.]